MRKGSRVTNGIVLDGERTLKYANGGDLSS
jgi:hypothetical protein